MEMKGLNYQMLFLPNSFYVLGIKSIVKCTNLLQPPQHLQNILSGTFFLDQNIFFLNLPQIHFDHLEKKTGQLLENILKPFRKFELDQF